MRIGSLERRLRWMWAALAGVLGGAFLLAMAPEWNSEIRARSFVVINDSGKPCGVLGSHDDSAYVALFDNKYRHRVRIGLGNGTDPGIVLYRSDEKPALAASIVNDAPAIQLFGNRADSAGVRIETDDTKAVLAISDSEGRERIHLSADDQVKLTIRDEHKNNRMELFSVTDAVGIGVKDIDGRQRILMTEIPGRGPVLIMTDGERKPIVKFPQ